MKTVYRRRRSIVQMKTRKIVNRENILFYNNKYRQEVNKKRKSNKKNILFLINIVIITE